MRFLVSALIGTILMTVGAPAFSATTWYGWDNNTGLIAYDADTGARTDLPGPGLYNMCLAMNPVDGELWGAQSGVLYSINKLDGTFVNEGSIPSGEACSFDLSGRFLITQGSALYEVDLVTLSSTYLQNIPAYPDGFDILPDGRWVANDTGTIYHFESDWTLIASWSGPANETIAADEYGRVFGSNSNDLWEIDLANHSAIQLWVDAGGVTIFGSEASSDDGEILDTARFGVSKTFLDGATDDVEVTLTCNGGLPLEQNYTLAGGSSVTFTLTEFQAGVTDCTITETGGPDGYTATLNGGTECAFDDIQGGLYNCSIVNTPSPVSFEVTVDWDISEDADPGVGAGAMVEIYCEDFFGSTSTTMPAGPMATMPVTVTGLVPEGFCNAVLTNVGSIVDANSCLDVDIEIGSDASCDITATAFYEGIPTLSQYGMALMALLMLGVGFVGFRRFV